MANDCLVACRLMDRVFTGHIDLQIIDGEAHTHCECEEKQK